MPKYNHQSIEKKWQKFWEQKKVYVARDFSKKEKDYLLVEFPYPSGAGLHVGHMRPYVGIDVMARLHRAEGREVMMPFGWDAFGLPAENYAIKMGVHPRIATAQNVKNAKRQINSLGTSFDWSREINTTDPNYYKWTQWIFLQFYKAGLAYEATGLINWCPKDKTGLANEEVIEGRCERCGTLVEKKELRQWYLRITKYAQKLIDGLKDLDWPEPIKLQQENWIGKSEGAEIEFEIETSAKSGIAAARGKTLKEKVKVFTTRPDTLFGVTYLVLAPEHPLIEYFQKEIGNIAAVRKYIEQTRTQTDMQRASLEKEKTGVELKGLHAVNPATGEKIPVWIADYVLHAYGTGAVMAVPAHDERDFEFAKKYKLEIKSVVNPTPLSGGDKETEFTQAVLSGRRAYTGEGLLINSGKKYTGMKSQEALPQMAAAFGKMKIQYKLRDWVFSRQRYWGEPIPIIHCGKCGIVPVPEKDLPVKLPNVKKYEPTGTGESPLAAISAWVNVKCPKCKGPAKRETNTMPQWAGSSWYFLRYADPNNKKEFANLKKLKYWMPIDRYFGGMEHTTLHLLYSRFWNQFLHDQKLVPVSEPYAKRQPHGIILAHDGEKMSKSRGNVVSPDEIIKQYGADTLRLFMMFVGPYEQSVAWNDRGVIGVRRFLDRIWNWTHKNIAEWQKSKLQKSKILANSERAETGINRLIKKVAEDIEAARFNTAVPAFMEFINTVDSELVTRELLEKFLITLQPFAPHIAEELWRSAGNKQSIIFAKWPKVDAEKLESETVEIVVQVNGKLRGNLSLHKDVSQSEVERDAKLLPNVQTFLEGKEIRKVIFVPNRLINFVA